MIRYSDTLKMIRLCGDTEKKQGAYNSIKIILFPNKQYGCSLIFSRFCLSDILFFSHYFHDIFNRLYSINCLTSSTILDLLVSQVAYTWVSGFWSVTAKQVSRPAVHPKSHHNTEYNKAKRDFGL